MWYISGEEFECQQTSYLDFVSAAMLCNWELSDAGARRDVLCH